MTGPQIDSADFRSAVGAFLAGRSTLTLATVDAQGRPLAANLFFASDADLNLYWVSGASSRHSLNLRRSAWAAVTVHNDTWTWAEIAGVQMEGQAVPLPRRLEAEAAWVMYLAKFPFAQEFQAEIARSTFYRFKPEWIRLIDNARGFGHKEELVLAPPREGLA